MDMAMAEAGGDSNKPHPVLRSHICHPPHWLERAVCCAIQSRLCMALEMEYLLSSDEMQSQRSTVLPPIPAIEAMSSMEPISAEAHDPHDAGEVGDSLDPGLLELENESLDEKAGLNVGLPLPPLSEMQQMWQLYGEAIELASQLLPAKHALTIDAQKAAASALDRWSPASPGTTEATVATTATATVEPSAPVSSTSTPAKRKGSLPSQEVPKAKDSPKLPELAPQEAQDDEFLSRLPSMLLSKNRKLLFNRSTTMPSLGLSSRENVISADEKSKTRRNTDSNSHGDWVKRAPPGDVFYRSLPWSFGLPGKSPKNRRKKKKADAMATQAHDGPIDPFKDWAKEFMHLENMTLFQRKLRTLDGISSLHTDMKIETKRFRQFMQDLELYGGEEQERLGNNRILYTEAGMKALRMGQQRNEQLRKQACQTSPYGQKFIEREKQLFGYYGLGILETQETSRCLNHGTWNAPATHCGNPPKNGPLKWENHL